MDRNIVPELDKVDRVAVALRNVQNFADYAADKLPPHISEDLRIVCDLAAIADDNIVQELCEALAEARRAIYYRYRKADILDPIVEQIDAALAKAGFNEGGAGNNSQLAYIHSQLRPSDEAVERVARAIADFVAQHRWEDMAEDRSDLRMKIGTGDYDVNEPTKDDCREAARAAIAAMPEQSK